MSIVSGTVASPRSCIQTSVRLYGSNLSPAWHEARAAERRYFLREVRRLLSIVLGVPFSSPWFQKPATEGWQSPSGHVLEAHDG
jgi:hypothetical protein